MRYLEKLFFLKLVIMLEDKLLTGAPHKIVQSAIGTGG